MLTSPTQLRSRSVVICLVSGFCFIYALRNVEAVVPLTECELHDARGGQTSAKCKCNILSNPCSDYGFNMCFQIKNATDCNSGKSCKKCDADVQEYHAVTVTQKGNAVKCPDAISNPSGCGNHWIDTTCQWFQGSCVCMGGSSQNDGACANENVKSYVPCR
jgi:hypothetical protein